jgi:hypothetical protein
MEIGIFGVADIASKMPVSMSADAVRRNRLGRPGSV